MVLTFVLTAACSRTEAPDANVSPESAHIVATHDQHAEHAEHAWHTAQTPALPQGPRWSTDEPLRTAMERIRTAVEHVAPAFDAKQIQPADAQALAAVVEDSVSYMVANCKLEPQADAALHMLIGRMLNAATSLKRDPAAQTGVPQLLAALHDYQSTFDHPDWTAPSR
jgi:hypothetical protein